MPPNSSVDTKRVTGRRTLRFETIDDALADAEAMAAAAREGRLRTLGNWSLGQILGHLATWVGYAYDGVPVSPPLLIRWIMKPMKKRFLYKQMPVGVRIPRTPGGTFGTDPLSLDEGLERYRRALTRLKTEAPQRRHPIFGEMTHAEWVAGQLRHAELHLSFVKPA
jgi:hypothetical protein